MADLLSCEALASPEGELCIKSNCFDCNFNLDIGSCPQKLPEGGEVLTPWVYLIIEKSGTRITVGNQSTPGDVNVNHNAVISSFSFGHSDGMEGKIVIHDQQGSEFGNFMKDIIKDVSCMDGESNVIVHFGWIKAKYGQSPSVAKSHCINAFLDSIDANFSQGKFIYDLTFRDLGSRFGEMSTDEIMGANGEEIALKDAIIQLFTTNPFPVIKSVRFLKAVSKQNGSSSGEVDVVEIPFQKGDEKTNEFGREAFWKGPKGKWSCNSMNKLEVALGWLQDWLSEEGKGWVPTYNWDIPGGEIIFWSTSKALCGESLNYHSFCVGHYIVNGGKLSPVLEFNPKIRWNFGSLHNSGGGVSSTKAGATEGDKVQGRTDCATLQRTSIPGGGQIMYISSSENMEEVEGSQANSEANKAQTQSAQAIEVYTGPITADMVIVGDPTLSNMLTTRWRTVSIVFINPYYILPNDSGKQEWLAKPSCNTHLSNKYWWIDSVLHTIEAGIYKTTLGIHLDVPGIDFEIGESLGGPGEWKPPVNCSPAKNQIGPNATFV